MTVEVTLITAGSSTGPFNLYSNVDYYASAFETNITKDALEAGYISTLVPETTISIRVKSEGNCKSYVDLSVSTTTTTTTTTAMPV
jgi:hypothetical protein